MRQLPSLWFVLHIACALCGAQAAHLELSPPGLYPVRWPRWDLVQRACYLEARDAEGWWLILEAADHGGDAGVPPLGMNISAQRAAELRRAFAFPRSYRRVRAAGLDGDAGFCPSCDVPYCARHWANGLGGPRSCPLGHPRRPEPRDD